MSIKLLGATLLVLGPLMSAAQTTPRLYVGASAALLRLYPFERYARTDVGPAITAGLRLSPRWAVETGAQVAWGNRAANGMLRSIDPLTYDVTYHARTLIVPLLARYTLTSARSPLQVDLTAGAIWLHQAMYSEYTYVDASGSASQDTYSYTLNDACVTLGPQLRYAVSPKVDLKLSVPVSLRVSRPSETSFASRLLFAPQLGIQYTFQ